MKHILFSILVVAVAFYFFTTNSQSIESAIANKTVADSTATSVNLPQSDDGKADNKPVTTTTESKDYHLPSILNDRPEQIINHSALTISWNEKLCLPNYVAWILTEERVSGDVERLDDFQPDPLIDNSPTWADYRGSGYDRGHMCPSADNKHSMRAQKECFYMTNMCPQTHSLNAGDWNELEGRCRKWTKKYGNLYIVSGPVINGYPTSGKLNNEYIANGKIIVPDAFFKVIMRCGQYGAKAIGFICPNGTQNNDIKEYAVTVDHVEAITGIDFFCNLPDAEENKAEERFDLNDWK
ncbi:MAG: DNA/RNA non-specific endonuclease [Bacteroidaceae bacterium]|nr:DNA/RNA non-specific endonuclease [Bacteroidaceae bacterium]